LRAEYSAKELKIEEKSPGIFRYKDWLPVRRNGSSSSIPIVFQSETLAHHLGLKNLLIVFSGYWPEKGASFETCSFKELEALAVTARIPDQEGRTMVVSSAGNTGMAFLQICSEKGTPVIIVVPASALPSMWITREKHPEVILAVLEGDVDYFDAIQLGDAIAGQENFYAEGGAKNVARRDGMGTVVLAAAEKTGRIPDHYFQAIGSGTGGIGAWEMSNRLLEDGRFGTHKMRLHFVQNEPFTIMADAWQQASPELLPLDEEIARQRIRKVYANILSNRKPPYSITGGVFDALTDSQGYTYSVTNSEAIEAGELFEKLENCDIHSAAAVAVAGLRQAVAMGRIHKKDTVLLNITGGGMQKLEREGKKIPLKPDIVFNGGDLSPDVISDKLSRLQKVRSI
jgi:cysteate synthase